MLVTANPALQAKELRYVLEQSGAVGLFMVKAFRGNPMERIADEASQGVSSIREIVDLDDEDALCLEQGTGSILPDVSPDDAAQIQYASGTTGFPKGAVLSHRGLVNNARFYASRSVGLPTLAHPNLGTEPTIDRTWAGRHPRWPRSDLSPDVNAQRDG